MLPSSVVCIIQRIRKTASGFEEIDSSSFNSSLVFFFAVSLLNLFDRGYKKKRKEKKMVPFRLEKESWKHCSFR